MLIGVCGFTSTGSSAVSDFLKEFDDNEVLDYMEFILPYCPDGLEDLDYHLNRGSTKYNSTIAINRFRRAANHILSREIKDEAGRYIDEYLDSLVQAKWSGYGGTDFVLFNRFIYRYICNGLIKNKIFKWLAKFDVYPNFLPTRRMEYSANPVGFDEYSRIFIDNILSHFRKDLEKNLVLDQPFAGNDPVKSFKYFRNPKAIVVDRDPRDNYLFTIKVLKNKGRQIPTNTVENFVKYYRHMRDNMPYKKPNSDVMVINFEDMIYEYDKTTERIIKFLNLGPNNRPKSIFDPDLSIVNTQLYLRYPEYEDDIKYIEKELNEYLFNFEDYPHLEPKSGKMFYGKSPLNKR